jgi:hypothetical protein
MSSTRRALIIIMLCSALARAQSRPDTTQLRKDVEMGYGDAILSAGRTGDPSFIPLLQAQLGKKGLTYPDADSAARLALARLGDEDQLQYWYCRFNPGKDIRKLNQKQLRDIVDPPFSALNYIGGWFAVARLAELLDSDNIVDAAQHRYKPVDSSPSEPVAFEYPSYRATQALRSLFPDAPPAKMVAEKKVLSEEWKNWINANRSTLQQSEPSAAGVDAACTQKRNKGTHQSSVVEK